MQGAILKMGLTLTIPSRHARAGTPVSCGIPFPKGSLSGALSLLDGQSRPVPVQTRVLDRWPDGSTRWLLLDWQLSSDGPADYRLEAGEPKPHPSPVKVRAEGAVLEIDTGAARFRLAANGPFPFAGTGRDGKPLLEAAGCGLCLETEAGAAGEVRLARVWLDEEGPLRCKACAEGEVMAGGKSLLALSAEFDFFAGSSRARVGITLRNPRAASHPGGTWDLGDPGSVLLRDVSLALALPGTGTVAIRCSPEVGQPLAPVAGPMELYQDSSGGENWRSSNHLDRRRRVPCQFRGYRLRSGGEERTGLRASPLVELQTADIRLAVALPSFWQNYPKAVEAEGRTLTVRLFPKQSDGGHELQGGEQKTHVLWFSFSPDEPLDWCREAPEPPRASPEWYAASGAVPHLAPRGWVPGEGYERLIESAIEGPDRFVQKREVIDEYGWRHFGEIYGDHEAVYHKGPTPLVSHYNNQYDAVMGFAIQFFRTGDARWWRQMDELAWHVLDIDVYHTDGDKPAYNRGLFWHTVHYVDADTATHRTYPRKGSKGGGPANEQNYATGLMLHHFLTGSRHSRETAVELARWVIDMDDGAKTVFRWLAGGRTGLASSSRTPDYHGPGRGSGNSLAALLDGHRLTGDDAFLDKAEEIILRVIHPADDVSARNLLDAENRWFYTMFLQALGKYLGHKAERGELDRMYGYARASLLHYARWMAESEYPYLDKPERLEYPTETWAAQDMRKSEVFWFAWLHAEGQERESFRDRARFFYEYSVRTLSGMPTRHLCRPVVLLLAHGFRQAWFEENQGARAPVAPTVLDFGRPERFVPQKARAIKRAKLLAVLLAGLGLLGLTWLAWSWMR
ncbi:MAG: hypothetical protein K2W96_23740 [Gemmataceae bacterium]|nr:hypothetical protein [Gemmataceae bacterium]